MKRKIFSVLFALVLVLSFSLVTAVPVGAEPIDLFKISDRGDGSATWWAGPDPDPQAGDYALKLYAGTQTSASGGYITMRFPSDGFLLSELADVSNIELWVYLPAGFDEAAKPFMNLFLHDPDYIFQEGAYHNALFPGLNLHAMEGVYMEPVDGTANPGTWEQYQPADLWYTSLGDTSGVGGFPGDDATTLAHWKTEHTINAMVVGAQLWYGMWDPMPSSAGQCIWIDDFSITYSTGADTLALEQPAAVWVATTGNDANPGTETEPFLTIQHAIDILADGTVNVAAGTYYENVAIDESVTIQGAGVGSTIVDGGGSGSVFLIGTNDDTVSVIISNITIQNGGGNPHPSVPSLTFGAGIFTKADLTLNDAVVTNNQASYSGGGIAAYGELNVSRCTISNNTIPSGQFGVSGGGMKVYGTTVITDSTISGNNCMGGNGAGGGIMNYAVDGMPGDLTMTNCTVSGNIASSMGGGIGSQDGAMTLTNVTITGNSVTGGNKQGGGIFIYGGTNVVKNTIVAGNTASVGDPNIMKSVCTWTASNCITSGDPLIGSLQDNGGPTETHALLLGSPAIDTGDDIVCPATDQRGVPRPQGPASSDIGSYEVPYTVYVDDDWTGPEDCGGYVWGANAFAIIEDGINPVAEGGTVDVAAGTYNEAITIDKGLTLEGAQAGEDPTVEGDRTDPDKESTIQGSGGAAVTISADNVTIDGFQIENPTGYAGIRADGRSYITIKNNIVTNIDGVGSGTGNQGIAIVGSATPITDITIEDNQVNGIKHTAVGRSATGIWIGNTSGSSTIDKVVIQRNTVSNIFANTSAWGSGGYGAYGILINYGAYNTGDTVNAQVLDNTISNLEGLWAHGIGLEGDTSDAVVERNDISNLIDHKWYLEDTPDAVAVMVEDNDVADTVGIHFNNFSDVLLGVWNKTPSNPEVDATNNWWGHASGPADAAAYEASGYEAYGNAVSPKVDYEPWLLEKDSKTYYDKTLALKDGWTLVSTNKAIDATTSKWAGAEALKYAFDEEYGGLAWVDADAADLKPVDVLCIKTEGGGGVGINYSASQPGVSGKDLLAGWNLISSGITPVGVTPSAYDILSPLPYAQIGGAQPVGLTTLVSQGSYNQFSVNLYQATLCETDWKALAGIALLPYDGYWIHLNAASSFGVLTD